jgi:molybdenum cofactor guanylyltransferase
VTSAPSASARLVVGVFVGGHGSRMGGVVKGLLKAPGSDQSLIERLLEQLRSAVPGAEIVLVGNAEPYTSLGLLAVSDNPPGVGPLGGLLGLLAYAEQRGAQQALVLACDLPRLNDALIARLDHEGHGAGALVAEQAGVRNPLIARYAVRPALDAARRAFDAGARSLQAVLDRLEPGVVCLRVSESEASLLEDWDTLSELRRGGGEPR